MDFQYKFAKFTGFSVKSVTDWHYSFINMIVWEPKIPGMTDLQLSFFTSLIEVFMSLNKL